MTKRRGNNEGTISKRKDGRWEARYPTGINPATGKMKRATVYGKTRKEVSEKLSKLITKIQAGTFTEPNRVTVGQWLLKWMEVYQKDHLSPNFYARRMDLLRIHIIPGIGGINLMKLKPVDIKSFYNDLARSGRKPRVMKNGNIIPLKEDTPKGLSPATIKHIHNILNPAIKQAVKEGLVPRNVVADVSPPKLVKTRTAKPLTMEQAKLYLAVLKDDRLFAGFVVELTTGLRRGELMGLQWKDLQDGYLSIQRQVIRVIDQENGSTSLEYTDLKTPTAHRRIALPELTLAELERHMGRQNAEKETSGVSYQDEDLIFCDERGHKLDTRRFYTIHTRALSQANLDHTAFHDLRHTVATLLLQAGENIKTVQDILGHADIETTLNDYGHVLDEMKVSAAGKLNSILAEIIKENASQYNWQIH